MRHLRSLLCGWALVPLLTSFGPSARANEVELWPTGAFGDGTHRVEFLTPYRAPRSFRRLDESRVRVLVEAPMEELRRAALGPTSFETLAICTIQPAPQGRSWLIAEALMPDARLGVVLLDDRIRIDVFPPGLAMREIVFRMAPDPVPQPVPEMEILAETPPRAQAPDSLLFDEGLRHRRTQSYDLANLSFSMLIERHPRSRYVRAAMVEIAAVFSTMREYKRAGLALERALGRTITLHADSLSPPDLLWASSQVHAQADRPFRAHERAAELIEHFPAHAAHLDAALGVAAAALAMDRHADARAAVETGLELAFDQPASIDLHVLGSRIESAAGDHAAAAQHLGKALALRSATELLLARADTYFRAEDFSRAAADYQSLLAADVSGDIAEWARFQIANTDFRSLRVEAAIGAYQAYEAAHPEGRWLVRARWRRDLCAWVLRQAVEIEHLIGQPPELVGGAAS